MTFVCGDGNADTLDRTVKIKEMADVRPLSVDESDEAIRTFYQGIQAQ